MYSRHTAGGYHGYEMLTKKNLKTIKIGTHALEGVVLVSRCGGRPMYIYLEDAQTRKNLN